MSLLVMSCNEMSQGLQRKKFEFLYKLNNYAALFNGYTTDLHYFEDCSYYKDRANRLYEDINKMSTIEGYGTSRVLKEEFMITIELNIQSTDSLMKRSFQPKDNISKEYDVIIMNERVDNFITALNDEISKVGKE